MTEMIELTFAWGLSALVIGYLDASHDVRLVGWILVAMTAVAWIVNSLYTSWLRNNNASAMLAAADERRRQGGAY